MTCFLPARSTNLQVSSSTEAETTCNLEEGRDQRAILSPTLHSYLSWVFGKQDSRALISCFNTFKQAMIYQVCKRGYFPLFLWVKSTNPFVWKNFLWIIEDQVCFYETKPSPSAPSTQILYLLVKFWSKKCALQLYIDKYYRHTTVRRHFFCTSIKYREVALQKFLPSRLPPLHRNIFMSIPK